MNLYEIPEDTAEDIADDIIVAEKNPRNWERIANAMLKLAQDLKAGRVALSPENASRGIFGPETDGCLRVDIEALFVPVSEPSPSNRWAR